MHTGAYDVYAVLKHSDDQGMVDQVNFNSSEWIALRKWAEKELAELRQMNDAPDKDEIQTAVLRGQILFCKKVLSLPEQVKRNNTMPSEF